MTTTNCGDTCGLIDFTMAIAGDRLLPEERMKLAIEAVTSEKMSQRGAAAKYGVTHQGISKALKRAATSCHPTETQAPSGISAPSPASPSVASKEQSQRLRSQRVQGMRVLARNQGITEIDGIPVNKAGTGRIADALIASGHEIPADLLPSTRTTSSQPAPTTDATQQLQGIQAADHVPAEEPAIAADDDHPAYADNLNIQSVRQRVNADVQRSDRPADFKRAIELLTELDAVCTNAWRRRNAEPWEHDDWAHVSSEIEALFSIVGQRAEEGANEMLRRMYAVTVQSTTVP